jgi:hypothetical protein
MKGSSLHLKYGPTRPRVNCGPVGAGRNARRYDLILDVASNLTLRARQRAIAPGGICVPIGHDHFGAARGRLLGTRISASNRCHGTGSSAARPFSSALMRSISPAASYTWVRPALPADTRTPAAASCSMAA